MKKIILILSVSATFLLFNAQLRSQEFSPVPAEALIQANEDGIAIGGYDAVAFFDQDAAIVGEAKYSCNYQGKTWHFSSLENRDKFLASPEKFTPEYGGYCAHSIGKGSLVEADPESFLVREEKLYFYANNSFRNKEFKKSKIDFGNLNKKRKTNWSRFQVSF